MSRIEGPGTCAPADPTVPPGTRSTYVVAEVSFTAPTTLERLAAIEHDCRWCFDTHRVRLVAPIPSHDPSRAVLVFLAPDAESVRQACRHADLSFVHIWARREPGAGGGL